MRKEKRLEMKKGRGFQDLNFSTVGHTHDNEVNSGHKVSLRKAWLGGNRAGKGGAEEEVRDGPRKANAGLVRKSSSSSISDDTSPRNGIRKKAAKSSRNNGNGSINELSTVKPKKISRRVSSGDEKSHFVLTKDDPLTDVIEAHNTRKVRIDLDRNVVSGDSFDGDIAIKKDKIGEGESCASCSTTPNAMGKFVRRIILAGKGGRNDDGINSKSAQFSKDLGRVLGENAGRSPAAPSALLQSSTLPSLKGKNLGIFSGNATVDEQIRELLKKGRRAQKKTFRFENAINQYLDALSLLNSHNYPPNHLLRVRALTALNDANHAKRILSDSAEIVSMGLKHEDANEPIKALKKYAIAFRMRRDALGNKHPSLSVLLNMLGSIQARRGELEEAMSMFRLALNGRLDGGNQGQSKRYLSNSTKMTALREIASIYEQQGDDIMALESYQESLWCAVKTFQKKKNIDNESKLKIANKEEDLQIDEYSKDSLETPKFGVCIEQTYVSPPRPASSWQPKSKIWTTKDMQKASPLVNRGEMEVFFDFESSISSTGEQNLLASDIRKNPRAFYNSMFLDEKDNQDSTNHSEDSVKNISDGLSSAKINAALTLHHLAQIHRRKRDPKSALAAYHASLRGMKCTLGRKHVNVASILGSMANVHKEVGDFEEAYKLYKEVLSIETKKLGIEHPEVIITLHNMAMIETCRGKHTSAIKLFCEVIKLQRTVFGKSHEAVAITSACLGDVYSKVNKLDDAINAYKETLVIRTRPQQSCKGQFDPEVGKLLYKVGILYARNDKLLEADNYLSKALRIYTLNDIKDEDQRVVEANRELADVRARFALKPKMDKNKKAQQYEI
mmetsp:Transcript_17224/g.24339  ORF Transcript_17224/g.24339 Transcript_17224/m.24339 type:complete len:844 (+) Transcript_17224:278-2809(+)|eukprot:CAMPEP_0184868318 /NCGR_PEP_ID=MMETSP0580-20130426/30050_1 /TAXON_ID=1118495 /ORGANISM="Dactyliosolen fragilissimus" /LENGTH=843 /DNA_ID=CAMNT_0027369137 /DNA_START=185 /DNA_END=2716 /DNA_ORIENTATION=+